MRAFVVQFKRGLISNQMHKYETLLCIVLHSSFEHFLQDGDEVNV